MHTNFREQVVSNHPAVVVGELNVDLILERVNALPEIGKERIARGMTLTLGSSSAILASNASAIGLHVGFVGRVGVDTFGTFVIERLQSRGVDTRHVIETPAAETGLTVIYTRDDDRGAVVVTCGADGLRARRGDEVFRLPAVTVDPVDALGAGDSFNAGYLHQYVQGRPFETCLRYGLITGAFSTLAPGGTEAFDDIKVFERYAEDANTLLTCN